MSTASSRQACLLKVTSKLVLFSAASLSALMLFQYCLWSRNADRTYLMLTIFAAGLVGGFVSIQQRLPKIGDNELQELSSSWASILLIPINGGIFACVLHLAFLGQIMQGGLFPTYAQEDVTNLNSIETLQRWMATTHPATAPDLGKLMFWSFVAGFSERFVPQIIQKNAEESQREREGEAN